MLGGIVLILVVIILIESQFSIFSGDGKTSQSIEEKKIIDFVIKEMKNKPADFTSRWENKMVMSDVICSKDYLIVFQTKKWALLDPKFCDLNKVQIRSAKIAIAKIHENDKKYINNERTSNLDEFYKKRNH
ncbi:MAG: hypothetical protein HN704_14645 [Bacteroidetes bacterium]|nr:hypothetical protein [Bacteroidota bacterium]MBT7492836.1 hypothetical protein [Bacteroidota bacterium]